MLVSISSLLRSSFPQPYPFHKIYSAINFAESHLSWYYLPARAEEVEAAGVAPDVEIVQSTQR